MVKTAQLQAKWNLVVDLTQELRYGSVDELTHKLKLITYFTDQLALLLPDSSGSFVPRKPPIGAENSSHSSHLEIGKLHYHWGNFPAAISHLSRALTTDAKRKETLQWLAVSHMRQAEQSEVLKSSAYQNKLALPVSSPYSDSSHTLQAIKYLKELHASYHQTRPLSRWLIILNYLMLGKIPDEIPLPYRHHGIFLEQFYGLVRTPSPVSFTDRATELGVAHNDTAKGVAVEDFDHDGFLDIVTGASFGGVTFMRNINGTHFVDATTEMGLSGVLQPYTISTADYDNDGWIDLFVTRPYHHFQLFRNVNGTRFNDVTEQVGLFKKNPETHLFFTWHSTWADVDNDGDLDLFISQWGQPFLESGLLSTRTPVSSKLLINSTGNFINGNVRF